MTPAAQAALTLVHGLVATGQISAEVADILLKGLAATEVAPSIDLSQSIPAGRPELLEAIDRLEANLKACGCSFADVTRRLGIARSTITRWKSGDSMPRLDVWLSVLSAADACKRQRSGLQ